jgi:lipoprotein-anchoring transpeptidase ErfK/SrfK
VVKGILVSLVVLAALFFLPTTSAAYTPECPSNTAGGSISSAAVSCLPDAVKVPAQATSESTYHIVQPAETLIQIATAYNTSVDVLMLANPQIANPALIYIGDKLRIPSQAETELLRSEQEKRQAEEQRQVVASVPHGDQRWVDVDLQTQTVRAYQGAQLLKTFIVSTGTASHPTVTGRYHIWLKLQSDDMKGPGYDLKNVPYVMYFYEDYGLHGTYWHHNFGTPMSHGCVNMRTEDAAWLYDFTSVGTLVNVH